MNRPRAFNIFGVLILCLSLGGCYSGWNRNKAGGGDGDGDGGGAGGGEKPTAKPIGLVIMESVTMSAAAMKAPECSPVVRSLTEIRQAEASQRLQDIKIGLAAIADAVVERALVISKEDCRDLRSLQARAQLMDARDLLPADPSLRAKLMVHLRVAIWNGDYSTSWPSELVYAGPWGIQATARAAGYKRQLAISHFALTGPRSGFFYYWRQYVLSEVSDTAQVIEAPRLDEAGQDEINRASQTSAANLMRFLVRKASNQ